MSEHIRATTLPTLRQLEYVVAVAEQRHFGRAARACAVSQPALSKQIQEVERLLGAALFERTRPHIRWTPLGEEIVARARKILLDVQDIMHVSEHLRDPFVGRVTLGVIPTLSPYILPLLWKYVQEHHPELEIVLQEEKTDTLVESLSSGHLDLALVALPIQHKGLHVLSLFDDPFVLAVPKRHPLDCVGPISESVLTEHALILMEEGHCLRDHALSVCTSSYAASAQEIRASSMTTLILMVEAGLGMTLLPLSCIPTEWSKAPNVRFRPFSSALPPQRTIGLLWRPTAVRTTLYEQIGRCILTILSDLECSIPQTLRESLPGFFPSRTL